ncbi:MAG: CCA tRNA nucleotidyltransferase [Muribaculaceae bacterium]|nr:CCA tRNA nucleotidyltransferase [Muribaculaceae bacterium]
MNLTDKIDRKIFRHVGSVADALCRECYVVGGYVRDLFLDRGSKDIDFVSVGSGIEVAQAVAATLGRGAHLSVFRNFGTASIHYRGEEFEFVGARRESYRRDSRKPIVEDGTLTDDLSRRDLTINAMAISVNKETFGNLVDMFNGLDDLRRGLIRTPLDPDITFSDDPLRMMRAVRFATQLQFTIVPETFEAIKRNAYRLEIISRERVVDELMKIMKSPRPSLGWRLLSETGLLPLILPELEAMRGVQVVKGRGHKDNFDHTLQVLDNVAAASDNVWLRWAALFHDIAKPVTKRWDEAVGWTFHNHNYIGAKMLPKIFRRMKMPMDDKLKYVQQLVELHMRPIALVEDTVTDSAVRRLLVDAGDNIDDLMILCRADITSKNKDKVTRHLENFAHVKEKMSELEERDRLRCWQPPIDGNFIMATFGLKQGREVGLIKEYVREAMLSSDDPNDRQLACRIMLERGAELGFTPVINPV